MIFDGVEISKKIRENVGSEVLKLKARGITPALRCVVSSDDRSTRVYLNSIKKNCEKSGIDYGEVLVDAGNVFEEIKKLNEDKGIHGVMIMHPVPEGIDEISVLNELDPSKDVEGRTPESLGRLLIGSPHFTPCTAQAAFEMLKYYDIPLKGADVTIVGRSTTVGKPLSLLLMAENATVTVCHSKTRDLPEKTRSADVVIAAVGRAKMLDAGWFKEGASVIDVGINVVDGKVVGDVDFDSAAEKVSVSRVPGGVGSVTNAILLRNVAEAAGR